MRTVAVLSRIVIALGLLALAALKFVGPAAAHVTPAATAVGVLEAVLGIAAPLPVARTAVAWSVSGLGAALTAWTVWAGPEVGRLHGCGCFGGLHVAFLEHVLLAAAIMIAGAWLMFLQARASDDRTPAT